MPHQLAMMAQIMTKSQVALQPLLGGSGVKWRQCPCICPKLSYNQYKVLASKAMATRGKLQAPGGTQVSDCNTAVLCILRPSQLDLRCSAIVLVTSFKQRRTSILPLSLALRRRLRGHNHRAYWAW